MKIDDLSFPCRFLLLRRTGPSLTVSYHAWDGWPGSPSLPSLVFHDPNGFVVYSPKTQHEKKKGQRWFKWWKERSKPSYSLHTHLLSVLLPVPPQEPTFPSLSSIEPTLWTTYLQYIPMSAGTEISKWVGGESFAFYFLTCSCSKRFSRSIFSSKTAFSRRVSVFEINSSSRSTSIARLAFSCFKAFNLFINLFIKPSSSASVRLKTCIARSCNVCTWVCVRRKSEWDLTWFLWTLLLAQR